MHAAQEPLHHVARLEREPGQRRQQARIEAPGRGGGKGGRHGQAVTSTSRREMTSSGVTPSASASKLRRMRWRNTGRASSRHVLARDVGPPLARGARPAGHDQRLAGARAGAPAHPLLHVLRAGLVVRAGGARQAHRVLDDVRRRGDRPHRLAPGQDLLAVQKRLQPLGGSEGVLLDDAALVGQAGVVDLQLEEEAVELRLGQRVGALLLDGVLRGQHDERLVQPVALAGDGHRLLLHGLQQRGLRLGRRAVDLVGQQHVGEDRPAREDEAPVAGGRRPPPGSRCR